MEKLADTKHAYDLLASPLPTYQSEDGISIISCWKSSDDRENSEQQHML